jgi:hypothetical protein
VSAPKLDDSWHAASWEGARLNTLRAGARLSLPEKVAWLEEAHRAAIRLGALPDPGSETETGVEGAVGSEQPP